MSAGGTLSVHNPITLSGQGSEGDTIVPLLPTICKFISQFHALTEDRLAFRILDQLLGLLHGLSHNGELMTSTTICQSASSLIISLLQQSGYCVIIGQQGFVYLHRPTVRIIPNTGHTILGSVDISHNGTPAT